jgi:hypothetical protein
MISLHLDLEPASARALLDDVALASIPFDGQLRRDGQVHYLEASAPGYEKTRLAVIFDRDRSLHLALRPTAPEPSASVDRPLKPHAEPRREPRAVSESGAGAPSAASSSSDSAPVSAPGSSLVPRRKAGAHIDKANPYLD